MKAETLVVGAGVIGLAIGAEMGRNAGRVLVLERGASIGCGISSRGSKVVHSGIYYPTESLKRRFCVEGARLLYAYCDARGIAYRKCGKLVVATCDSEIGKIEAIGERARKNGVANVELIGSAAARALEPALAAAAALYVPETGIIDAQAYLASLAAEIESAGGAVLCGHEVLGGRCAKGAFELDIGTPSGLLLAAAERLVIAAGPWSHRLASRLEGYDAAKVPALVLAKGSYFSYGGPPAFRRLIYPAPVDGGLGIHLTLDLKGKARFGPDVEWLATNDPEKVDFEVDAERAAAFYESIRGYWPGLPAGSLKPDYSGVRPKLVHSGESDADFLIHAPEEHGIDGLLALYGIESPGLTSSLAIAKCAAEAIRAG